MQFQALSSLLDLFRTQTAVIQIPTLIEMLTEITVKINGFINELKTRLEEATGTTPVEPAPEPESPLGTATVSLKSTKDGEATLSGKTEGVATGQKVDLTITDSDGNTVTTSAIVNKNGAYSVKADIKGLVDGPLTVSAAAFDANQKPIVGTSQFNKDHVKGALTVAVTDTTDASKAVISGTTGDVPAGDEVIVEIKGADGTVVKVSAIVGPDGRFTTTADLSKMLDGKFTVSASAEDRNDKGLKAKANGELDAVDGDLTVTSEYVSKTKVTISGETDDVAAGKTVSLVITNNAGAEMKLSAKVGADGTYTVTKDLKAFADGPLKVVATVKDRNGNDLTADNDAPEGTISAELGVVQKETLSQTLITGTTSEIAAGAQVTLTVTDQEGNAVTVSAIVRADGSFIQAADLRGLVDGPLKLSASATDRGGNTLSAEDMAEKDAVAGSVYVTLGDVRDVKAASIQGQTQDVAAGDKVSIVITDQDGKKVTTEAVVGESGYFRVSADLSGMVDGPLSVSASASDRNDKTVSNTNKAALDAVTGSIQVGFGDARNPESAWVTGTVKDVAAGTKISVVLTDSEGATLRAEATADARGGFSLPFDLTKLADGDISIKATTTDRNGVTRTSTHESEIDLVEGSISVEMGSLEDLKEVEITGTTIDVRAGSTVSLSVVDGDGAEVQLNTKVLADGSFVATADLRQLQTGPLTVQANATDRNGDILSSEDEASLPVTEPPVDGPALPDRAEEVSATAGRVNIIDTSDLEGVQSIKILSQGSHGQVSVTADKKIAVVLTEDNTNTSEMEFSYEVTYENGSTEKVITSVTPKAGLQNDGWGLGDNYMVETDAKGDLVIEHGDNHRKVFISGGDHALTKADIAEMAGTTIAAIDKTYGGWGAWLSKNPAYGATEDMALTSELGMALWNSITANKTTSNHLLFERGHEYLDASRLFTRGANGESALNPLYVGAYGEGEDPQLGSMNVFQNQSSHMVIDGVKLKFAQALLGTNLLVNNVTAQSEGNFQNVKGLTIRESDFVDIVRDAPVNDTDTWNPHINRTSGLYISNSEGVRLDGNLFDRNAWVEGYDYKLAATQPQPPSMYSHNIYIQSNNWDLTMIDNVTMRGASFGAQVRSGGFIVNNVFLDNNAAVNFGGGITDKGIYQGNYTLLLDNLITSAGHKRVSAAEGALSMGIDDYGKQSSLIGNIVAHLADPNNAAEIASKTVTHKSLSAGNERFFNDTIIYKWAAGTKGSATNPDRNVTGLDASVMDQTTIQKFAAHMLGKPGATISDLADLLRAQAHGKLDKVVDADLIIAFFREGFGLDIAHRGDDETIVFSPDERGEGMRWDNVLNWSTGTMPGEHEGDSVDIAGNSVVFSNYTVTIDDFDFGDFGKLRAFSGKLSVDGDITVEETGATFAVNRSGQIWIDGYDDPDLLKIQVNDGRFANTGDVTGKTAITVSNQGQMLLTAGDANFDLTAGSSLTVNGSKAKAGIDGETGEVGAIRFQDGSSVDMIADANGFSKIGEIRSGAMSDGANVSSGIFLGGDLDIDVTALASVNKNGTYRLFEADELVFDFKSIDIEGLDRDTDAVVRVDYDRDVIEVVLKNGTGLGSVEYLGDPEEGGMSREMADIFAEHNFW